MRPNIIIFNPDEMRADAMGHLGNPAAHTPFLDELARTDAVSFENAYCQNPVCVPSRCSFTTGLYPHVHGHRTMTYLLRPGEESIFSELKEAGYYVWMNARNDLVAGQYEGLLEHHATEIFYGGMAAPAKGPVRKGSMEDFHAFYGGELGLDENGRNYSHDDEDVDAAVDMIRRKPKGRPLCLFLGLVAPHPQYQAEDPYFSMIDREKIPARIRAEECSGKSDIETAIRKNQHLQGYSEEQWRQLRAVYLGMTAKIDDQFQRLCNALKEAGEYDNSAIFFFSDHGDFTGDYGLAEKAQNTFEDCLTRVPFLIKPPKGYGVDPGISDDLVELVDFYATAMAIAGVKPSHTQYGIPLMDAIADRKVRTREFVTCEGGRMPDEIQCDEFHAAGEEGTSKKSPYYPRQLAQADPNAHAKGFMIRTDRYKLVARVNGKDEFYDLEKDPGERRNAAADPGYKEEISALRNRLLLHLMRTADVVPFDYDSRFTKEMIWARIRALVPEEYQEEFRKKAGSGVGFYSLLSECLQRFGGRKRTKEAE